MKLIKKGRDLIIAMSIGDGHVTKTGELKVEHGEKQKEYCEWKKDILSQFIHIHKHPSKPCWSTKRHKFIKLVRKIIGIHPKKISKKTLDRIGLIGLAIWYMDDGTLDLRKNKDKTKVKSRLAWLKSTWRYEDALLIKEWFKEKYDLDLTLKFVKSNKLYCHMFSSISSVKFFKLIKEFIHPSLYYKICPRFYNNEDKIKDNLCKSPCQENCPYKLNHLFCRPK